MREIDSEGFVALPDDEYAGINTEGDIVRKNGAPFHFSSFITDIRQCLKAGDIVEYSRPGSIYIITFVNSNTVHMKRYYGLIAGKDGLREALPGEGDHFTAVAFG